MTATIHKPLTLPPVSTTVVIVGAGIAGTWLGLKLARAGVDTLMVHYSGTDRGGAMGSSARSVGAINTSPIDRPDFRAFMEELSQGQAHPSVVELLTKYLPEEIEEMRSLGEFKRIKLGIALQGGSAGPFLEQMHRRFESYGGRMLDAWVTRIVADEHECRGLQYQQGGLIGKITAGAVVLASGGYAGLFDGSVKTNNYGTLLGRFLEAGGYATNLEFIFKHGYGKPDLGALTPTEELPGAEIYDTSGCHVEWLEKELYDGRGTANHLEAFRHWRGNRDKDFFIDLTYRPLYSKLQALNLALMDTRGDPDAMAVESAVRALVEMCPAGKQGPSAEKLGRWVEAREKIDFDKFTELKPFYHGLAKGEVFRVRQIAYFSMGGIAHVQCATNLPNVYVTGEAMHDFGAHRVGGLPWGFYLTTGRVISDHLIGLWKDGRLSPDSDFDLIEKYCVFDGEMLQAIRAGLYRHQEWNFNVDEARKFIGWLRHSRRELRQSGETLSDSIPWLIMAEAVMQSSLRRVESRGCFYRADHPMASEHLMPFFSCAYHDTGADVVDANLVRVLDLEKILSARGQRNKLQAVAGYP